MDCIHCDHRQLDTSYLALAIGLLARTGRPVTKIPLTKGRWLREEIPGPSGESV